MLENLSPYFPLIAISGPIIGAIIGAAITYRFIAKRKRVDFYVQRTEDLTLPLQAHQSLVVFKIGSSEVLNLNRAGVRIKNSGNTSINNFEFDIEVPGAHQLSLAEKFSKNTKLYQAIETKNDPARHTFNPITTVKIPFLNVEEQFEIGLFFDGEPDDVNIHCRIEELEIRIKDSDFLKSDTWQAAIIRGILSGFAGFPIKLLIR
ncbi:MAG: hypothetical protein J0G33_03190 [Afipia felis]|nr:hypothetical protein [Afipia felis]